MQPDKSRIYLITGAAGFIGYFLSKRLLKQGCRVVGIDNINSYYDIKLKFDRLEYLKKFESFTFIKGDIADKEMVLKTFEEYKPDIVVNLAAQAGVRNSIDNPDVYIQSNINGFFHILEACRYHSVKHLIYASSSSVYGANNKIPFEESDSVDHPVSLYAATKKSNELMAYTYSHLFHIPSTGLRFFTVYGPLGRPDMAYFNFADLYFRGDPIRVYNNGDFEHDLYRDFTYIDDIIEGIIRLMDNEPQDIIPHRIFNIGNNKPVKLMLFIQTLEKALSQALGREVLFDKIFEASKPGDVPATYASTDLLHEAVGFQPSTTIEQGLKIFAEWYVNYYHLK